MSDATEAVDRGVELLDRKVPGWRDLIDTEEFALESTRNCIVGQLARKTDVAPSPEEKPCVCGCGLNLFATTKTDEFAKWLLDSEAYPMWAVELAEYGFYAEYSQLAVTEAAWRAAVQGAMV